MTVKAVSTVHTCLFQLPRALIGAVFLGWQQPIPINKGQEENQSFLKNSHSATYMNRYEFTSAK